MTSPKPPTDTLPRVRRGGAWHHTSASFVRSAYRYDITPSSRGNRVGFRTTQSGCRQQVLKGMTPP